MTSMTPESSGGEHAGDQQAAQDRGEAGDEAFRHAREAIAVQLSRRGVRLTGQETAEDLTEALEAVERFEGAVERNGGDLMVDEPVGGGSPIAPDNAAFVLPQRHAGESIPAFIERVAEATARAKKQGGASR